MDYVVLVDYFDVVIFILEVIEELFFVSVWLGVNL